MMALRFSLFLQHKTVTQPGCCICRPTTLERQPVAEQSLKMNM